MKPLTYLWRIARLAINPMRTTWSEVPKTLMVAAGLGGVAWCAMVTLFACTKWQWSMLMDDFGYLNYLPYVRSIPHEFAQQIRGYWSSGRFYPVKYLANLIKWRFLPLQPNVFHAFNLILLMTTILITAVAILKPLKRSRNERLAWIIFLTGFALLQRPLLDVVALNTIAEGWVILFLALGLVLYEDHPWMSRIAFLLCSLSKEPAIVIFGACTLVQWEYWLRWSPKKKRAFGVVVGLLDLVMFVGLALVMNKAQRSGLYLADYRLLDWQNVRYFTVGLIKCAFGLMPLALGYLLDPRRTRLSWKSLTNDPFVGMCFLFGLGYLYLAVGRGVAGYLLIPSAFAFYAGAARLAITRGDFDRWSPRLTIPVALSFALCLVVSLGRYERYVRSINESSLGLRRVLVTQRPRLLFVNGMEAADSAQSLVAQNHLQTTVRLFQTPEDFAAHARTFSGDVFLFEMSSYFGRYSEESLRKMGESLGGWTQVVDAGVYRIFYGNGGGHG
jgi:hypothetical protein